MPDPEPLADPFPSRGPPTRVPRGSRAATGLSFGFASILALGALLAAAAGALPSLGGAILAALWITLPGAGAAGCFYLLRLARAARIEIRPIGNAAAFIGFLVGLVTLLLAAVLAATSGPGAIPPMAFLVAVPIGMGLALLAVSTAKGSGSWAPVGIGLAGALLPAPLAVVALLSPPLSLLPIGLLGMAGLALTAAGFAHVWVLSDLFSLVPTRSISFIDADLDRRIHAVASRERSVLTREQVATDRERTLGVRASTVTVAPEAVPALTAEEVVRSRDEIDVERSRLSTEALRLRQIAEDVELRAQEMDTRAQERATLEKDLEAREQALRHRETDLHDYEQQLAHQLAEITERSARITEQESDLATRLATLPGRESAAEDAANQPAGARKNRGMRAGAKDQALKQRESELLEKSMSLVEREKYLESWAVKVEARAREVKQQREFSEALARTAKVQALHQRGYLEAGARREESLNRRERDMEATVAGVESLRIGVNESLQRVGVLQRETADRQRLLVEREADLQEREEQLQRRELEFTALATSLAGGQFRTDHVLDLRERQLRKQEEEFLRRSYEKEKELEIRRRAVDQASLPSPAPEAEPQPPRPRPPSSSRASSGIPRFDELLAGGIPWMSTFLVVGPAFVGKHIFVGSILAEGLRQGEPVVLVCTSRPPVEVAEELAGVSPHFTEGDRAGLVYWIDASSRTDSPGRPLREGNRLRVDGAGDLRGIYEAVVQLEAGFKARRHPRFRFAYMSLSQSLLHGRDVAATEFFQLLTNRLRQTRHLGVYIVENGILTERQQQALEHLCDGAVVFRKETQRNYLAVQGFAEVLTRDWVPYQFTRQTLHLGAFNLERIK